MVFSVRLPNRIGLNYQRMPILLTFKEPKNTFFDTVLRVKIFVEGRGVTARQDSRSIEGMSGIVAKKRSQASKQAKPLNSRLGHLKFQTIMTSSL